VEANYGNYLAIIVLGVLKLPYNFRVNGSQTQTLGQKLAHFWSLNKNKTLNQTLTWVTKPYSFVYILLGCNERGTSLLTLAFLALLCFALLLQCQFAGPLQAPPQFREEPGRVYRQDKPHLLYGFIERID
jgi:hypothetical protein